MRYEAVEPLDRETIASRLQSSDEAAVCRALVAAALHDPDWLWVLSQCEALIEHPSSWVRRVIPICFSHLARIHREVDRARIDVILERLASDPTAEVRGAVQDAGDDLETFLGRDSLNSKSP